MTQASPPASHTTWKGQSPWHEGRKTAPGPAKANPRNVSVGFLSEFEECSAFIFSGCNDELHCPFWAHRDLATTIWVTPRPLKNPTTAISHNQIIKPLGNILSLPTGVWAALAVSWQTSSKTGSFLLPVYSIRLSPLFFCHLLSRYIFLHLSGTRFPCNSRGVTHALP